MNCKIFQIFYSEDTMLSNDKGFLQLDNLENPRPDWREYWPIRNYLLNNELSSDYYYGFFSPKFKSKTNLDSGDVYKFISELKSDVDVVTFSPFFDQSAFPLNVFIQLHTQEDGVIEQVKDIFLRINSSVNIENLVMSSKNTIFCNYFAAKKDFWIEWLSICETIYSMAEDSNSKTYRLLNSKIFHDGASAPLKVFVIERVASYLLSTNTKFKTSVYNPMQLPYSGSPVSMYLNELCILDSLKISFTETGFIEYIESFNKTRNLIINKIYTDNPTTFK